MKKGFYIHNKTKDTAEIYLYGYIAAWDMGGKKLIQDIKALEGKTKKLNIFINSDGGSIAEGIAMYNILSRTSLELAIYVDGVAASMAAALVQIPGAKRYMAKNAKMMLHKASGGAHGSAEELRSMADQMDDFEDTIVDMVADRTGLKKEDVIKSYFNGKDNWLNAAQALKAKLIDGIVDGKVKEEPKDTANLLDVIDFYEKQIINFNSKSTDMDLTNAIVALNMPADSTEAQVMAKIKEVTAVMVALKGENKTLTDSNKELQGKVDAAGVNLVKNLVSDAVTAKKITEDQRATFEALATADFDNAKKVLDGMKGHKTLTPELEDAKALNLTAAEKEYTFSQFQQHASAKLVKMKTLDPDMYKKLYKNQFGKDPQ